MRTVLEPTSICEFSRGREEFHWRFPVSGFCNLDHCSKAAATKNSRLPRQGGLKLYGAGPMWLTANQRNKYNAGKKTIARLLLHESSAYTGSPATRLTSRAMSESGSEPIPSTTSAPHTVSISIRHPPNTTRLSTRTSVESVVSGVSDITSLVRAIEDACGSLTLSSAAKRSYKSARAAHAFP